MCRPEQTISHAISSQICNVHVLVLVVVSQLVCSSVHVHHECSNVFEHMILNSDSHLLSDYCMYENQLRIQCELMWFVELYTHTCISTHARTHAHTHTHF